MSGAGAFLSGLTGGYSLGADMKRDRKRDESFEQMWSEWKQNREYLPRGDSDGYYAPPTKGTDFLPKGTKSSGRYGPRRISSDPVASDLPGHQKAMLNAIAYRESAGAYDIRYTPRGGEVFQMNGKHPRVFEKGPHGPSSAAGRYQFTATTWDRMGGGEFSPERQDRQAWALASDDYKARTGRNLDSDLRTGGLTPGIVKALSPTWAAFNGEADQFIDVYNDSLSRFAPRPEAQGLTHRTGVQ